ncbi:cytochrome c oxidase subunit II [Sphingomonas parva]|uniref:cytochrome c oxidase subunit II n=1 Tax=Sphingomonas parva TaxID=2555898 RepID=UPI00142F7E3C|nr:cytochrome c oxidase subunit II [Sphingomonas parva]
MRRDAGGMRWIYIGVSVSTVALIASAIWTLLTLRAVAQPGGGVTPLAISVTGHQWWWEATYPGAEPDGTFRTASEIHIPTNVPVRLELRADDVIHSFWVPKLAGKTDVIPGRVNSMWIEARTPGVYRGQCMEYCGVEHALMAFRVVAEPPAQFAAWRRRQLAGASTGASIAPGYRVFARRCSACHAIRGTESGGIYGPDLTNLSGRATLASGTLPNTPANLARWIAHPQAVKPGARMPDIDLPPGEMQPLVAYLETR